MGLIELTELYNSDKRFKQYVDKYAACHRTTEDISIRDILKHKTVKEYAIYLKESDEHAL